MPEETWKFAVSGDSRNCGDVVMPAIAASALRHQVAFYWHLGDFRKMSAIDEDMAIRYGGQLTLADYRRNAWGDFVARQVSPFGTLPVYLGIGNHETYGDRTRGDFANYFANWLDAPEIRQQRATDFVRGDSLTYYHWQKRPVDFITLDNASDEGFSAAQIKWLEGVLEQDKADPAIRAVVVGMHRALPNSLACGHSMNDEDKNVPVAASTQSIGGGRQAYRDLLHWRAQTGKNVYVLASHSHFFMERIYETPYWQNTGAQDRGVLPGWIVGTAGAIRYAIPDGVPKGIRAETLVSGYLLATVSANGEIRFEFEKLGEHEVPRAVREAFGEKFVGYCFKENAALQQQQAPPSCADK